MKYLVPFSSFVSLSSGNLFKYTSHLQNNESQLFIEIIFDLAKQNIFFFQISQFFIFPLQ